MQISMYVYVHIHRHTYRYMYVYVQIYTHAHTCTQVASKLHAVALGGVPTAEEIELYTRELMTPGEIQSHGCCMVVDEQVRLECRR